MTAPDTTDVPDYASLLRLDGGRYLVLGAGQGIGRQSAHALVANGAQVICVDLGQARVEAVVAELGPAATAWTGDITQAALRPGRPAALNLRAVIRHGTRAGIFSHGRAHPAARCRDRRAGAAHQAVRTGTAS